MMCKWSFSQRVSRNWSLCFGVYLHPSGEETVRRDARYLPFKNNVFDVITAIAGTYKGHTISHS